MSGISSIRLASNFDAANSRHWQKLYPPTARNRASLKTPAPPDRCFHSRPASDIAEPSSCSARQGSWFPQQRSALATRRRQLQQAGDGEHPFTYLANAGVRGEFRLGIFPPDHGGNQTPLRQLHRNKHARVGQWSDVVSIPVAG